MITPERIRALIQAALADARVNVEDTTGTGDHFQAVVVSAEFEGKSLVEQHQMVYGALRQEMAGAIHALQLRTYTPSKARAAGVTEEL
jgi:stress-induced morphogen